MDLLRPSRVLRFVALAFLGRTYAQTIVPSNASSDVGDISTTPRYFLQGSEFPSVPNLLLAPLGVYQQANSRQDFLQVHYSGQLVDVNGYNANDVTNSEFLYLSCDGAEFSGNLSPSDIFAMLFSTPNINFIILYSEKANHCTVANWDFGTGSTAPIGVLTTVDPVQAAAVARLNLNVNSPGSCALVPDPNSFTNVTTSPGWGGPTSGILGPSPTTAVAMIILYSITGIITALFIFIIVTGAVRAHRHPERYGPRVVVGRGRQSRAKGIARAMLETLPIVKFGDHQDLPAKKTGEGDIELNAAAETTTPATHPDQPEESEPASIHSTEHGHLPTNADGTTDEGTLGCSICTEDFTKGEEVRVLPCNHKFHPECVDPWLLNVSGTCPLCRIDLRSHDRDPDGPDPTDGELEAARSHSDASPAPPLDPGTSRRDTVVGLGLHLATGTREERISALRRLREERRRRGTTTSNTDAERRGIRERLRERFRVRTMVGGGAGPAERRGTAAGEEDTMRYLERLEILERRSSASRVPPTA